jgi:hypothetical protein
LARVETRFVVVTVFETTRFETVARLDTFRVAMLAREAVRVVTKIFGVVRALLTYTFPVTIRLAVGCAVDPIPTWPGNVRLVVPDH